MKNLSILFFLLWAMVVQAQVKIGDNPQAIHGSSVLELESTSRVLVVTRISSEIMNAMAPLAGAIAFNIDTDCMHYYNGVQWLNLCDALTNSGNIRLTDNGDGTYTFTDADEQTTIILNTTVTNFERENDSLVLIDSANRRFSVALDSLSQNTYSTNAIFLPNANDSTIVITKTDNHYNFEVGRIGRENYGPSSISGAAHIQNGSIPPGKLVTTNQSPNNVLQIQMQGTPASPTAVWAPFNANLLTGTGDITSSGDISIIGGANAALAHVTLGIADDAVSSLKILDGSIEPIDIQPGTSDQLLTTDATGNVIWLSKNDLGGAQVDQITITGQGTTADPIKVADSVLDNIAANTADITQNSTDITTNTADIAANTASINTHITNDEDISATNELQDIQITGTILNLTNPATPGNQIDLDDIFATDAELGALSVEDADADPTNEIQALSSLDGSVTITPNGNDFDLSVPANTDNQDIETDNTPGNISIDNGSTITLNVEDADADPTNEIQALSSLDGSVTITPNGNDFDLSVPANTDNQDITTDNTPGNISIDNGSTISLNVDDDDPDPNNEIQDLAQVLAEGADANATVITNLADPILDQDAATKAYVDNQIGTITIPENPIIAFGKMNGSNILNQTNVFSINNLGPGNYRINFANPASSIDYIIQLTLGSGDGRNIRVTDQAIGSFTVQITDSADAATDSTWFFTVIDL